tara:strand:+ start:215 stop:1204 length:990 start_codon:yes stop_codon:yes gene_type:complete
MANKYNLSKEYQFDIDVAADNYVGKLALPYVTAAVKSPDTVAKGYVKQIDGLRKAANLTGLSLNDPVKAATCDFDDNDISLDQTLQTLTLTDLEVNQEVCRGTIFPTWLGEGMARNGDIPTGFSDFLLSTVAAKAGESIENGIWLADTGGVYGTGFLSNDGAFDEEGVDASACKDFVESTIATITNANAVDQFGQVYDDAVANVPGILNKPDVGFYVGLKTYGLYMQELAAAGNGQGINSLGTNQTLDGMTYLGIPIRVCPGMPADAIVLTYRDNMVYGTNLATDWTEARIIPTYQYDGSDNVRVVMHFAIGVQVAVAGDGVVGATFWT